MAGGAQLEITVVFSAKQKQAKKSTFKKPFQFFSQSEKKCFYTIFNLTNHLYFSFSLSPTVPLVRNEFRLVSSN